MNFFFLEQFCKERRHTSTSIWTKIPLCTFTTQIEPFWVSCACSMSFFMLLYTCFTSHPDHFVRKLIKVHSVHINDQFSRNLLFSHRRSTVQTHCDRFCASGHRKDDNFSHSWNCCIGEHYHIGFEGTWSCQEDWGQQKRRINAVMIINLFKKNFSLLNGC